MFKRFADDSRYVMAVANQHALRLNHDYIGLEHVLLALLSPREGRTLYENLKNLGYDVDKARKALEIAIEKGPPPKEFKAIIKQTQEVKTAVERAIDYAQQESSEEVQLKHIFLGTYAVLAERPRAKEMTESGPCQGDLEKGLLLNP